MISHRQLWMIIACLSLGMAVVACQRDAAPIQVLVTATPSTQDQLTSLSDTNNPNDQPQALNANSTLISATLPSRYTPTPSPIMGISPTPTFTPSPTLEIPTPTDTPAAPVFTNVPPPESLPTLDMTRFGIQIHPLTTLDEWNLMLQHTDYLNFNWIKIQLAWDLLEPVQGQFSPLFDAYVQRVQWANFQAQPHKVLISVVNAPDWARPIGFDPNLEGPPADPVHLANFIQTFIRATKPEDNRIAAIEIWNEPNLIREWNGMPMNGQTYMTYFDAAYRAIKEVAPNITVVTAGLAPVCGISDTVCDREFLRQMYAGGLANYPDVKIGIHPYSWANPPDSTCCTTERGWADNVVFYFLDTLNEYRQIMIQNGDADGKLWITEFGWGTYQGVGKNGTDLSAIPPGAEFFGLLTAEQQAQYVIRALEMLQTPPLSDFVEVSILWNLNFALVGDINANPSEQAGYSILDASGYPRLVYYYLATANKILSQ